MRALLLIAIVACSGKQDDRPAEPVDLPTRQSGAQPKVTLTTADQREVSVNVEVVAHGPALQKGLMFREHLAPDAGMLFLMGEEKVHAFYMRNTLIPLDMLFITQDFVVVGIVENAVPRTEELRSVGKPSSYVLEVNGGWSSANRVTAGAKVRFENVTAR